MVEHIVMEDRHRATNLPRQWIRDAGEAIVDLVKATRNDSGGPAPSNADLLVKKLRKHLAPDSDGAPAPGQDR